MVHRIIYDGNLDDAATKAFETLEGEKFQVVVRKPLVQICYLVVSFVIHVISETRYIAVACAYNSIFLLNKISYLNLLLLKLFYLIKCRNQTLLYSCFLA